MDQMNNSKSLNPYSVPPEFRAYLYDSVILAKETKSVKLNVTTFDRNTVLERCGLDVLMVESLDELQLHDLCEWPAGEFLLFLKGKVGGHEVMFKRLRDSFAHGHYESMDHQWIAIRHRYQTSKKQEEMTYAFGCMKLATLRKLIAFLGSSDCPI